MHFSTGLTTALASVAVLGQQLSKPAAWPNLNQFAPTLLTLPKPTTRISRWTSGNMSKGCRDRVVLDNRDPTTFTAYTVYMGDCADPWILCREAGAEPSIEGLVDTLARIPIGMRQFIGDVVHFKGGGGASAWQSSIVHLSGDSARSVSVLLHEASHCVDGANGMGIKSSDTRWRDAYNADSHVADNYARTSHVENFAQYPGLVIYNRMTNSALRPTVQYQQLVNQLLLTSSSANSVQSWGSHMFDFTGTKTCGRRWPRTPAVNPATGALITKRNEYIYPRNPGVEIVPLPEELADAPLTNCTIGDNI